MAGYSALAVVARSLASLLTEASPRDAFPNANHIVAGTAAITGKGGSGRVELPTFGLTVYPYRVSYNSQRRPSVPRVAPDGGRFRASVLLDLHLLVSAWAQDAEQQMRLLAWAARTIEDTPVLTGNFLNRWGPGGEAVFESTESVEVVGEPLSLQDLVAIWEVNKAHQQPSLGYIARMIAIDSDVRLPDTGIVRSKAIDYAKLEQPSAQPDERD